MNKYFKFFLFFILCCAKLSAQTKIPVLFAHGFGGSKTRRLLYTKGYEQLVSFFYQEKKTTPAQQHFLFDRAHHRVIGFNFSDIHLDLGIYGSVPNPLATHLAQHDDIKTLHENLENIPEHTVIGFGVSRGAATWLTMLGSKKTSKKLALVILESPFANSRDVFLFNTLREIVAGARLIFPTLDVEKTSNALFQSLFQTHQPTGIQPIDSLDYIDKSVPIFLVHSAQDGVIPLNHSRALYIKLREYGHQHAYLLELTDGDHAGLLWSTQSDLYCAAVNALYKRYGLPYDAALAQKSDLGLLQPSITEVKRRMKTQAIIKNYSGVTRPDNNSGIQLGLNIPL